MVFEIWERECLLKNLLFLEISYKVCNLLGGWLVWGLFLKSLFVVWLSFFSFLHLQIFYVFQDQPHNNSSSSSSNIHSALSLTTLNQIPLTLTRVQVLQISMEGCLIQPMLIQTLRTLQIHMEGPIPWTSIQPHHSLRGLIWILPVPWTLIQDL